MEDKKIDVKGLRKDLVHVLSEAAVLTDPADLMAYRNDASWFSGTPLAVVLPTSTEEVKRVLTYGYRQGIPMIPRGSGTGLSGGIVPVEESLVIDMGRMNKILEIDRDNMTVKVQAGVITAEIHRAVEREGLFYPPDPASQTVCTIGGNIATRAGGPRGVKYGTTKDYILGLEAVLPPGEVLVYGGKVMKLSVGYEFGRLLVGSEGTLGIITEAILKVIPKPKYKKTMLVSFNDLNAAATTVSELVARGVIPTTLELMDQETVRAVESFRNVGYPTSAEGVLLIECDGAEEDNVTKQMQEVTDVCRMMGAQNIVVAANEEQVARLWLGRRSMFAAFAQAAPTVVTEDVTVPRRRVPDIVRVIKETSARYNIRVGVGGHAGDGNMHPNFMVDKRDSAQMEAVEHVMSEVAKAALEMGGVLSGEHGVGLAKAPFVSWQLGPQGIRYMQAIKKVLDPANLMNPGKLWTVKGEGGVSGG
ncbi:MAG: FAD-binding oxidoreductase [Bacillota bacterium]|uniref:FAD-binding protein n=1 Tax=Thermanaerosceptrum fracticalcis TaxID=1712410 RepID=A0A7G6E4D2_THEFR|nr:FAD-linked oxidase C-terminal domain-containing protein [Thermanaerosceptrum fracticalcis]QNB46936.1 FAD-binding protein [Thermanaerosceptrum fracticalcis]